MSSRTFGIIVVVCTVLIFGVNRYMVYALGPGDSQVMLSGLTKFGVDKPSCECRFGAFGDCIRNTIENKRALMEGYKKLASKWGKFWTSTESGQRVELNTINFKTLFGESKRSTLEALLDELDQFKTDVEEMSAKIGPTKGCGYEFSSESLEMETDPLECKINMVKAKRVEEAVPCNDLYKNALRHEVMHLNKCEQRKSKGLLLTPRGLALEEAEGYAQEIAELEKLQAKNNCSR